MPVVAAASLAAFTGAYLGSRWLTKVTIDVVDGAVSAMLVGIAFGLISGLI